jgi:hypothetical protein
MLAAKDQVGKSITWFLPAARKSSAGTYSANPECAGQPGLQACCHSALSKINAQVGFRGHGAVKAGQLSWCVVFAVVCGCAAIGRDRRGLAG